MYVILAALSILLPFVGYMLDGKAIGDVWQGVKYIFGFVFAAILIVVLIKFLSVWSVLLFPAIFIAALYFRKVSEKKNDSGPLDSRDVDINR